MLTLRVESDSLRAVPAEGYSANNWRIIFKNIRSLERLSAAACTRLPPRERSFYADTHVLNKPGLGIRSPLENPDSEA